MSVNRVDRLDRLEQLLRLKSATTASALAAELEISVRSVYRDLDALRARGLRIDGEAGPGGGVRLDVTTARTNVQLKDDEIVSLWLATELARRASVLPFDGAVRSALDRILGALPEPRRRELRATMRRVIVGEPSRETSIRAPDAELLRAFEEAFTGRLGLRFDYVDRHGSESRRTCEPHGLLVHAPLFYVLAIDCDKREPRMFRMDRVRRARVARDVTFTPDHEIVHALSSPEAYEVWRLARGGRIALRS
jgi:predicted DNA-binding transcriptional regulator YafY